MGTCSPWLTLSSTKYSMVSAFFPHILLLTSQFSRCKNYICFFPEDRGTYPACVFMCHFVKTATVTSPAMWFWCVPQCTEPSLGQQQMRPWETSPQTSQPWTHLSHDSNDHSDFIYDGIEMETRQVNAIRTGFWQSPSQVLQIEVGTELSSRCLAVIWCRWSLKQQCGKT